jgi:hypothetical protein
MVDHATARQIFERFVQQNEIGPGYWVMVPGLPSRVVIDECVRMAGWGCRPATDPELGRQIPEILEITAGTAPVATGLGGHPVSEDRLGRRR